ncbi:MAG: ATP-grasp peptide maturase system methyltransferase [Sciscionella sp.]
MPADKCADTTATGGVDPEDIGRRLNDLADTLTASGELRTRAWRDAFTATWRHLFVPRYFHCDNPGDWPARWRPVSGDSPGDHDEWLDTVYSDETLITDLKDQPVPTELSGGNHPVATSSSTRPSLMLRMLEDLDIHTGHTVLEIGTGTGYNAALLSRRLGEDHVRSVDIDPELVALARQRLAACGLRPHLIAGDGEAGWPAGAPYDRVIATCGVETVPLTWIQQTRPGGKIMANLHGPIMRGALALLDVGDDGTASGSFLPGYASFMALRHDPSVPFGRTASTPVADHPAMDGTTATDPASLRDNDPCGFFVQLHLSGIQTRQTTADDGDTGTKVIAPDGSWAVAWHIPEHGRFPVTQAGPRRLWDAIELASQRWTELGHPSWKDFRITITPSGQHIHLRSGDGEQTWTVLTRR